MKLILRFAGKTILLIALLLGARNGRAADYVSLVTGAPNLLGYWRFDGEFGTNSVVNGFAGTLEGNAAIGLPGSGYPLPLDPTNQALLLGGAGSLTTSLTGQITNEGSVMAWVYLTNEPSVAGHFFQITSQAQSGDDFDFQIQTDNHIHFYTDSGSSTVYPQELPLHQWHFLAATFVANNSRVIYLDGSRVASSTPGAHSVSGNRFSIGNNLVFGGRYFEGKISEVAVFNRALSAGEIAAIYAAAPLGPPLSITPMSASIVLTWPTNYQGFTVQTNADLGNVNGWSNSTAAYGVESTNFSFTNIGGLPALFFRLIR